MKNLKNNLLHNIYRVGPDIAVQSNPIKFGRYKNYTGNPYDPINRLLSDLRDVQGINARHYMDSVVRDLGFYEQFGIYGAKPFYGAKP